MSRSFQNVFERQKEKIKSFDNQHVILTKKFMDRYKEAMSKERNQIEFYDSFSIVTTSQGVRIFIPNQWFYFGYIGAPIVKSILQLKDRIKENSGLTDTELKNIISSNKNDKAVLDSSEINNLTIGMNKKDKLDVHNILMSNDELLGELSWFEDNCYIFPVLKLLQLDTCSSSYIAEISKYITLYFDDVEEDYKEYFIIETELAEVFSLSDYEFEFKNWVLINKKNGETLIQYIDLLVSFAKSINIMRVENFQKPIEIWDNPIEFSEIYPFNEVNRLLSILNDDKGFIPKIKDNSKVKTIYKTFLEWVNHFRNEGLKEEKYKKALDNINRQCIYFGAPGTGKSHNLKENSKLFYDVERVTFHPSMTYGDFIGSYKPFVYYDVVRDMNGKILFGEDKKKLMEEKITYRFVEGPLIKQITKALLKPNKPHLLIIEELNRANVSAVFGDTFQLLDRNELGDSEYPVNITKDLEAYFNKEILENNKVNHYLSESIYRKLKKGLFFPSNLYIWATMNNADQGVMPMDTAFKRRWDYKYFGINDAYDEHIFSEFGRINLSNGKTITWDEMRRFINDLLTKINVQEDKLLGPYFLSTSILKQSNEAVTNAFKSKVIMYLFEDIGVHNRPKIFNVEYLRLSTILEEFENKGEEIFFNYQELYKDR